MASRLGVDVGGTFTDLIYYDHATGGVRVGKGSTVPSAPDVGVVNVVRSTLSSAELDDAALFFHATTVGINAIVERKGAVLGLLTTDGFRDSLELARADRADFYNMLWKRPAPLIPRKLRIGVTERIRADGVVHLPLDHKQVEEAAEFFIAEGVESIGVVFINSYANPAHEIEAERILRSAGFQGHISLSYRVTGEYREYERTATTVIDAYVRPRVSTYLSDLEGSLTDQGFSGDFLVTRSGGGSLPFSEAELRPFETVMSGPVAGAAGAAELCRVLDLPLAVTADVGGTTFDTCIVLDGQPQQTYEGRVAGMPLQTTWIDVRSIGAGGGSIAYVENGMLRVGPRSAGAVPGPICYGIGGTEPTVTDAMATLGMLGFGELAGGVSLDIPAASAAIEQFGRALNLSRDRCAQGIVEIMAVAMAGQIRAILDEAGEGAAESAVIAFGGAGPLFGSLIAKELGAKTVVVPNFAGNFSAWGLLLQDLSRSAARTLLAPLDPAGLAHVAQLSRELRDELVERVSRSTSKIERTETVATGVDLRYKGQEYFLTLDLLMDGDSVARSADEITEQFSADYARRYGHALSSPVEIVSVRVSASTALPKTNLLSNPVAAHEPRPRRQMEAFSFAREARELFTVVDRAELVPGSSAQGPLIVLEETATTYVDVDQTVVVHATGTLMLTERGVA